MKKPTQYKLMILLGIGGLTWTVVSLTSVGQSTQTEKDFNVHKAKNAPQQKSPRKANMELKELTKKEANVILHRGTEPAFSGKFVKHDEEGIYTCRQCGEELFHSSSKFDSRSGWPSFDDQITDSVSSKRDADGRRAEIVCAACDGHLGHVFIGELMTDKDTRYCVNSLSLDFAPQADTETTETAVFAGGCFWGIEHLMKQEPGVLSTSVGYTGGPGKSKPTYEQVCTKKTGHAEAIEILFDPNVVSYEKLAKLFFEIHDFTQLNRQGPDIGSQYRSAVFYHSEAQHQTLNTILETLKQKGYDVKTELVPASQYWAAEVYHQDYYTKTGKAPYCHVYKKIFD